MLFQKDRTSEHIENLININSGYLKLFNARLKANNLFNEFDHRAREDLMNLIKLSQERYKSVKSGNDVEVILNNQKENFNMIINNAKREEFYNTSAISEEKRKFLKIRNKTRNKELIITRAKIRDSGNNLISTNMDEKFRLNKVIENENKNINSANFLMSREKSLKTNGKLKHVNAENNIEQESSQVEVQDHLLETNRQYSDFIEDDMKKFDLQMEDYINHLRNLKQSVTDGDTSKVHKNYTFLTDDINMLSYKPKVLSNVIKVSDTDFKLDIQKLMKLSRRYKNKFGQAKNNHNLNHNQEENDYVPSKSDIGKGIYITKREIMNLRNLDEILEKKRNYLEKYIEGIGGICDIEDYEKILKKNFTNRKNSRIVTEDKSAETQENFGKKNKLDQIKEEMKRTLEETKKEWNKDSIKQEKLEKLEKERRMLNRQFLNEIKSKPKFYQKFVDPYSIREDMLKKNDFTKDNKNIPIKKDFYNCHKQFKNKENLDSIKVYDYLSNNEILENLKKNIATESERNEDDNSSFILGAKCNEVLSEHITNRTSNQEKIEKIYEEFQEYKELIIEKEKHKQIERKNLELNKQTKKYLEMLDSKKNTLSKFNNKKQEDIVLSYTKRDSALDKREISTEMRLSTRKISSIPNVANLIVKQQSNPMLS